MATPATPAATNEPITPEAAKKYQDQWAHIQANKNKLDKTVKSVPFKPEGFNYKGDLIYQVGVVFKRPAMNETEYEIVEDYKDDQYLDTFITKSGYINLRELRKLAEKCKTTVDNYFARDGSGFTLHGFAIPGGAKNMPIRRVVDGDGDGSGKRLEYYQYTDQDVVDSCARKLANCNNVYITLDTPTDELYNALAAKFNVRIGSITLVISKK